MDGSKPANGLITFRFAAERYLREILPTKASPAPRNQYGACGHKGPLRPTVNRRLAGRQSLSPAHAAFMPAGEREGV